jgi:hypothetical protein
MTPWEKTAQANAALQKATQYIGKIGRVEAHFTPYTYGKLHSLEINTQICHQESHSAQNYWKCVEFDDALAEVVREQFADLAKLAILKLQKQYSAARLAEKDSLLAQLAEIERIENDEKVKAVLSNLGK